jgi:hypothetical protein
MNAKPMEKLAKINMAADLMSANPKDKLAIANAADKVKLNETTRIQFEIMARDVFRKYKALYPEDKIKPFIKQFNAIEAIYDSLLLLPQESYPDKEVDEKTNVVYQHIYTNYYGGGKSVYNIKVA